MLHSLQTQKTSTRCFFASAASVQVIVFRIGRTISTRISKGIYDSNIKPLSSRLILDNVKY